MLAALGFCGLNMDTVVFLIALLSGFALGYAVRAAMSLRRHRAAMKRRYLLMARFATTDSPSPNLGCGYGGAVF